MKKNSGLAIWSGALALGLSLVGCQPAPPDATPAEKAMREKTNEAGESIKEAGAKTVEAGKATGEAIEEKVEAGVQKTKDAFNDAKQDIESPAK